MLDGQPDQRALDDRQRSRTAGAAEPTNLQLLRVWSARAETAWLAGNDARAAQEAERGLAAATTELTGWVTGELVCWVHRAGGMVDPAWPAAGPFALELSGQCEAAAEAWDALGCPYEAALARLDGAAAALRQGLAPFESLGARRAAARTRQLMQHRGVRPPAHGLRRSTRTNPA